MIRWAEPGDPRLAQVPGDPLLAAVIEAEARAGGGGAPGEFWLALEEGGQPAGGICRVGGLVWATVSREEAAGEAADFLRALGWRWLETDSLLAPLLPGRPRRYPEMAYRGPLPEEIPLCPPSVMEAVRCNVAAGALAPALLEERYAHLHLLARRGAARVFLVPGPEGAPAAAAAISHLGSRRGVIGYLAALPERRGRGCGSAALGAAVRGCLEAGREPVLACREELAPFYRARGFEKAGEIWAFEREAGEGPSAL